MREVVHLYERKIKLIGTNSCKSCSLLIIDRYSNIFLSTVEICVLSAQCDDRGLIIGATQRRSKMARFPATILRVP